MLLHHRSPGYSPTGLVPWCLRAGETALWEASETPWHMKREMSIYEALQQLFPKWNGNLEAGIVPVEPGDKASSAKGVSATEQCSRESKQIQNVCIRFSGLLLTEKSQPWTKVDIFISNQENSSKQNKKGHSDRYAPRKVNKICVKTLKRPP